VVTNSQIWAPGQAGGQGRKTDAAAAMRYVAAYLNAGLPARGDKWQMVRAAERLPRSVVVGRTCLLEAIGQANSARSGGAGSRWPRG
jgi:hypothetical protein